MNLLQRLFGPKKTTLSLRKDTDTINNEVWVHLLKDGISQKAFRVNDDPAKMKEAEEFFEQAKERILSTPPKREIIRTETI